jgi:hypothetical protein
MLVRSLGCNRSSRLATVRPCSTAAADRATGCRCRPSGGKRRRLKRRLGRRAGHEPVTAATAGGWKHRAHDFKTFAHALQDPLMALLVCLVADILLTLQRVVLFIS